MFDGFPSRELRMATLEILTLMKNFQTCYGSPSEPPIYHTFLNHFLVSPSMHPHLPKAILYSYFTLRREHTNTYCVRGVSLYCIAIWAIIRFILYIGSSTYYIAFVLLLEAVLHIQNGFIQSIYE